MNKVGFRNCTVFRNWSSETISWYSETLVFRNYFVVFRNYFVIFRNYFVVFRNYCPSCSETFIPKLGGDVNNHLRGQLMRSFAFRVGWGEWGWGSKLP